MKAARSFARAARTIAFVRHMPIGKLVRRAELGMRRRLRDRLSPMRSKAARTPQVAPVNAAPLPLFAPRTATCEASGAGHTFTFLNRTIAMGAGVDWSPPGAAADQLWRMNLHYMEYLESVGDRVAAALIEDWIAANPAGTPGAWRDAWNSYALSLRVVVWMQQLARRGDRLPAPLIEAAIASIAGQIAFLEQNLETDIGGNHLIKNIKALIWASRFFTGPDALRWRDKGIALLSQELSIQILSDGMHAERSPSYHAQVFADLLECRHVLGADPVAGRLDRTLHLMAQVCADLVHPDGGPPLFNDAGLTMAYSAQQCLAGYARVFGRRPEARQVFSLPSAGYFGLRTDAVYALIDCGRIAPDDLPAHGHGDVLAFEWSVADRRIVVDQGVFEYVDGSRRRRSKAAASHNTLCIAGADQADFFGSFRCGRRPNVEVRHWRQTPSGFILEGTHDGFTNLHGRPRHVRRFEAAADRLVIADRLEGGSEARATIGFLLHPEVGVTRDGGGVVLRSGPVTARVDASCAIAVEPAVWWPDMGRELATNRLVLRPDDASLHAPSGVTTSLVVVAAGVERQVDATTT